MPGLSLHGSVHFIIDQQIHVLHLVLGSHPDFLSKGFQIDRLLGQMVVVLEGKGQLLHALLHLGDEDETAVQIRINHLQVVEAIPVVDQQVKERTCEFHTQHYVLSQRFTQQPSDELVLPSQGTLLDPPVVRIGQEFLPIIFYEPFARWIECSP